MYSVLTSVTAGALGTAGSVAYDLVPFLGALIALVLVFVVAGGVIALFTGRG